MEIKTVISDLKQDKDPPCRELYRGLKKLPSSNASTLLQLVLRVKDVLPTELPEEKKTPLWLRGVSCFSVEVAKCLHRILKSMYLSELRRMSADLAYWRKTPLSLRIWSRVFASGRKGAKERALESYRHDKYKGLKLWKNTYEKQLGRLHRYLDMLEGIKFFDTLDHLQPLYACLQSTYKFLVPAAENPPALGPQTPIELLTKLELSLQALPNLRNLLKQNADQFRRPNHIEQHWMKYCLAIGGTALVAHRLYRDRDAIVSWSRSSSDSLRFFIVSRVIDPLINIGNSIFNTFRGREALMASQQELARSKEDLSRMILDFGKGQSKAIALRESKSEEVFLKELEERAQSGDMSIVMGQYTEEVRRPLSNVVSGHLLTGLLIQIQKVKVGGESMMVTLDQILHANEITFNLLTCIPAAFVLGFLLSGLKAVLFNVFIRKDFAPLYEDIQSRMRQTQNTLIRSGTMGSVDLEDQNTGKLLLLLDYLEELAEHLPAKQRSMIMKDLLILSAVNYSPWQKHIVVTQMYRTYPFLSHGRLLLP